MSEPSRKKRGCFFRLLLLAALIFLVSPWGAAWLMLHPPRFKTGATPPESCRSLAVTGEGILHQGWIGAAKTAQRRGTVIFLHGIMDNRGSSGKILNHFQQMGFDAVALDLRAHGESGGDVCTFGVLEKRDLSRVIDSLSPGPVVLMGTSLGAAIALQTAAVDNRISAVVAAESF